MKKNLINAMVVIWVFFWILISGFQLGHRPSEGGALAADLYEDMRAMYGNTYSKVNSLERYETMQFELDYQKTYHFKKGTTIGKIAKRLGTDNPEMVAEALDMDLTTNIPVDQLTIPERYKIDFYHVSAVYTIWNGANEESIKTPYDFSCRKTVTHHAINVRDTNHRGAIISGASIVYDPENVERNSFIQ